MSSLATRCQSFFSGNTRSRGYSYFQNGHVALGPCEENACLAFVRGSNRKPYEIFLNWEKTARHFALRVDCDCPHFEEGEFCKHIWATLLAIDQNGASRSLPIANSVEVFHSLDVETGNDFEATKSRLKIKNKQLPLSNWETDLQAIERALKEGPVRQAHLWPSSSLKKKEAWFILDSDKTFKTGQLTIGFHQREQKLTGGFGALKELKVSENEISSLFHEEDREIFSCLLGIRMNQYAYYSSYYDSSRYSDCRIAPAAYDWLLPKLCTTRRFGYFQEQDYQRTVQPLDWDVQGPWEFRLDFQKNETERKWILTGKLVRQEESFSLDTPLLLLKNGLVLFRDRVAKLRISGNIFEWIALLRDKKEIHIPFENQEKFVAAFYRISGAPPANLPKELGWKEVSGTPQPIIHFFTPNSERGDPQTSLCIRILFDYDGNRIYPHLTSGENIVDKENRIVFQRNVEREEKVWQKLRQVAIDPPYHLKHHCDLIVHSKNFLPLATQLIEAGYQVEAEGQKLRRPGNWNIRIQSEIDWFDLRATVDFDGTSASLPALLQALKKGQNFVRLGDGTSGLLPEEWCQRYAPLALLGEVQDEHIRFKQSQALLLDCLLADHPGVDLDKTFQEVRSRLSSFAGIKPQKEPSGFQGTLRHYQRAGLGWLLFLDEFGLGGCLADDMGLGKTIQVLALLQNQKARTQKEKLGPSLVIVPKSLVYNWMEEAKRFTPDLKILDYTGFQRKTILKNFDKADLIITTYGLLRKDVLALKEVRFHYVILDEAQAIKNVSSQTAKSARLLLAKHRLALSGTPVENRLEELWSLFEFLNPGLLGHSNVFKKLAGDGLYLSDDTLQLLSKALRPFILRRTKEQVLKELPPKQEQTIFCELDKKQKELYEELSAHYRRSLSNKIAQEGIQKSKMHVLEALLRLRQAACHPGLIDKTRSAEPSAKVETLMEQLKEILAEGHKALVFSQFTSLLAIVRAKLDREGIVYEYLDGSTRNRKERVERFQTDSACPLFLISLKAGGLGLNLTAADYIFILDPWWNPAVEAQAIDRAHRIGQTRHVFAYRLIAKETVEEKILQLQAQKRHLTESILSMDSGSLMKTLTAEDLQILLS